MSTSQPDIRLDRDNQLPARQEHLRTAGRRVNPFLCDEDAILYGVTTALTVGEWLCGGGLMPFGPVNHEGKK